MSGGLSTCELEVVAVAHIVSFLFDLFILFKKIALLSLKGNNERRSFIFRF